MKKVLKNIYYRFYRLADWLSGGANSFFFDGEVDESISGRSYRMAVYENSVKWNRARKVIDKIWEIVFREHDHCRGAYYKDLRGAEEYQVRHELYMKTQAGRFEKSYIDDNCI